MNRLFVFVLVLALAPDVSIAQDDHVSFARQILPILSNKCFVCHGPDARDKDLVRLDSFAGATTDLGGHFAIDKASPEDSEILMRIHSDDDPMPPEESTKKLTDDERDLLTQLGQTGR